MPRPPPLQPCPRFGFRRGPGDLDQGHRAAPAPGRADGLARRGWRHLPGSLLAFAAGQLHPRRFTLLLDEVRRPGCIAETGGLVLPGKLEERVERSHRLIDSERRVADPGKPVGHGVDEHRRQESLFAADGKTPTWTQCLRGNSTQSPVQTQLSSQTKWKVRVRVASS